jgi:hypothetical protein
MIGYILVVPVLLVVGYVLARYHHRLRDLGIGAALGSATACALAPAADPYTLLWKA